MGAVWYRARILLRRRALSTVLLIALVAVPGGVVLASAAGAIRTRDALPGFLAYNRRYQEVVFVNGEPDEAQRLRDEIADLPQWDSVVEEGIVEVTLHLHGRWVGAGALAIASGRPYVDQDRPIVVEGRLPDPDRADEVTVNEALAADLGIGAGDRFELRTVTPDADPARLSDTAGQDPDGETVLVTASAIVRGPADLRAATQDAGPAIRRFSWSLGVGPSFVERFRGRLFEDGYSLAGRPKAGATDALEREVHRIAGDDAFVSSENEFDIVAGPITRTIEFEANVIAAFALLITAVSTLLVGQALARQVSSDLQGDAALRVIGLAPSDRVAVPVLRAVIVGVGGALAAVAVAVALSPLFPVGLARNAELRPGTDIDGRVLAPGALLLAGAVAGWSALVATRAVRRSPRPDPPSLTGRPRTRLSTLLARSGAPSTVVLGVRLAFERGRGRTAAPVLGAAIATTAGVVVLSAGIVLSSSLDHIVGTPVLQGWNWDVAVGEFHDLREAREALAALRSSPEVASFDGFGSTGYQLDGQQAYLGITGPGDRSVGPVVLEGRLPNADREVALGRDDLRHLHLAIGDDVPVTINPEEPPQDFRVVGMVVPPVGMDDHFTLGRGGVIDLAAARAAFDDSIAPQNFLVRFTPGTSIADGLRALRDDFGDSYARMSPGNEVEALDNLRPLPRFTLLLVGMLVVATMANVLIMTIRRRRRDFATLATLGLRPRQLFGAVVWQATTYSVVAVAVGLPLGVAAGNTIWRLLLDALGSSAPPTSPVGALAALAVATVVVANLVAILPGRAAAHLHPATALRAD